MKYKCLVCGQIIDNPDKCPVCGAGPDKIVPYVEEELTWADEHVIGVAKGVDEFVLSGLRVILKANVVKLVCILQCLDKHLEKDILKLV